MKVHYINILLLKLLLNILAHNQRNLKSPIKHKAKIHKILCEYDLYTSIYDNDPEMKSVMEQFDRQTSKRFREYDERMHDKRMKCKEQCDKEIQQIILKDKIEKELKYKFGALQTDLDSDAIPTCVCEKSLADKTEKICLTCGKNMGAIAPCWGLVSGVGYAGWLNTSMLVAAQKGIEAGIAKSIEILKKELGLTSLTPTDWKTLITAETFNDPNVLFSSINELGDKICVAAEDGFQGDAICAFKDNSEFTFLSAVRTHTKTAAAQAASEATSITDAEVSEVTATSFTYSTAITASIVAIVVIVLVMLIIYLILRYRRKMKMKKKLQYIKLLKE
ncbi:PIR protein [Plasmodium sp. gorilla clade G2]|uniref:PIR protein n=1 Tax=Plasmodium sp. gorilla clade G2 TaxID=880535 RepID=UPI000D26327E|nr:PIR protein [Plasmodium sp. gorilla clade G2]SOV20037.1 PIR protein [Plasmodium sp. gorilla clade G2]